MSSKPKQFKIYGPLHFRYTWDKYLEICKRDGTNASKEIREFIEGQVARRDPGNPQTTMESHIPGTEDALAKRRSDMLKDLLVMAERRDGELKYLDVVQVFREQRSLPGHRLVPLAKSMCEDLKKLGVTILWPAKGQY